jgi:hypothetical protein
MHYGCDGSFRTRRIINGEQDVHKRLHSADAMA